METKHREAINKLSKDIENQLMEKGQAIVYTNGLGTPYDIIRLGLQDFLDSTRDGDYIGPLKGIKLKMEKYRYPGVIEVKFARVPTELQMAKIRLYAKLRA